MEYRRADYEAVYESDLALERRRADTTLEGVEYRRDVCLGGVWERLKVTGAEGEKSIGRPAGLYDTLTIARMDKMMPDDVEDAKEEVARELGRICDLCDVPTERILVVGLGNRDLTPDALGPLAADEVEATMHLKAEERELFETLGCSEICVFCPDVTVNSGMMSAELVKCVADAVRPTAVLAIDSLASRSEERLGSTVQVTNTGIIPGTGVGQRGARIDGALLGVPVISIGIPTVIGRANLCGGEGVGEKDCFLSPKGINRIVKNGAKIIGGGINRAFGISYF